ARSPVPAPSSGFQPGNPATDSQLAPPGHGRVSPRRHRRGRDRGEPEVASREPVGIELAAALNEARPRIERCLRQMRALRPDASAGAAVALIRALESAGLSREQRERMRALQASIAAIPRTTPRTITVNVETSEGEARIVDIP